MRRRNKTYITGGICLVFAAWIIWQTGDISLNLVSNEPGPRLFPYIAAGGIILCSVLSMIFDGPKEKKAAAGEPYLDKAGWKRLGVIFVELIVFAIGINIIGFLFAGILAMFVLIWTLKGDKPINKVLAVCLSIAIPAIVYFSFTKLFVIPLPSGSLWKLLGIKMPF